MTISQEPLTAQTLLQRRKDGRLMRGTNHAVTLNCDMGESFGLYRMGDDSGLMPLIDVANVACGFHASDPNHMHQTVLRAKAAGVRIGSHPGLPDLQGFGRREMRMTRDEVRNAIVYQTGALLGFMKAEGMELHHIKPHGSLYFMAMQQKPWRTASAMLRKSSACRSSA